MIEIPYRGDGAQNFPDALAQTAGAVAVNQFHPLFPGEQGLIDKSGNQFSGFFNPFADQIQHPAGPGRAQPGAAGGGDKIQPRPPGRCGSRPEARNRADDG